MGILCTSVVARMNSRWGGGSAQMALLGIYRVGNFEGAIIQQKRNRRGGPPRRTANNRNGTAQQVTEPPLKQFLRLGEALENGYVLSSIGSDSVTLSRGGGKLELQLETASKNLPSTVAAAAAAARTPRAGDLFFQPLYNNRTVDNPVPERIYAAELNCRLTGPVVDFQAAFFAAMTLDGIETRTYYDDMASVYCDMAVTGVGRMSCGAEAAADIRLSYRWLLSLAASAGRYEYIRDPRVTVLSDVDNSAVDVQAVSRMGGCETGGAPQLTALAEISWFGPKGWGCRASAGYAGRRYVEPMPLRRTDRIAGQGGITREFFDAFTRQERLPDAFTLDAALFKSFRFERSRLTASLMLRNLTGEADTVYGGYESLRVRRIRPGDDTLYAPHASRCTYAWPRSFYLTISYRF